MKVFLFSHRGALGDFVLTWPALVGLRWKHPEHRFLGLGRPDYLKLAREMGMVDMWMDCEDADLLPFYSGEALPKALEGVDSALLWMEENAKVRTLLSGKAQGTIRLHPPVPGNGNHAMDHHMQALAHFSLPAMAENDPYFPISAQRQDYALIHPGSGSAGENYDPEFYAFLANEIKSRRHPDTRIVLGPGEKDLKSRYENRFPVEEPRSALELAMLLGKASLFIGNDSGVSHLAAILGTKTLAMYKNTDPVVWGVRGRAAQTIEAVNEAIAMTRVQKALQG